MSIIRAIDVHEHALDDIRRLRIEDPDAAAAVLQALDQIKSDPSAIDKLTTYGNNEFGTAHINVKPWERMRRHSDVWRFRILDTPATRYRVIYGYQWQTRQLCVLAVVHKEGFDYDDLSSEIAQRIIADWRAL